MSGAHQAAAFQTALDAEYEALGRETPTVVAGMWDSSTTWPRAKDRSTGAAETLAGWLRAQNQPVHLVAHSLGGRVTLEALDSDPGDCIESVALLGAAVDPDSVCHTYHQGIEAVDGPVYSYHSENDGVVCRLYRVGELSAGLGCRGSDCRGGLLQSSGRLPSNYSDIDVSEQVTRHLDYYKPAEHTASGNCVGEIVSKQLLDA
jgi:pimeloyl-ACP methyl ester carboxylesterase